MKINNCFINTIKSKFNISILITFENKDTFYLTFEEILEKEDFKELKKDSFFKDLPIELKYNIGINVLVSLKEIEDINKRVEYAEKSYNFVFNEKENKGFLPYSNKEYIKFLKDIKNKKVFNYKSEIDSTIDFLHSDKTFKQYLKYINKNINEILKEIDT